MAAKTFWTVVISFALTAILPISAYLVFKLLMTRMITRDNAGEVFDQFQAVLDQGAIIIHDPYMAASVADKAYRAKEAAAAIDGWNNPMRITAVVNGDSCQLTVTSAGPDGAFGTADDMPMQRTFDLSKTKAK
jgi:hypothetical protein